MVVAMLACGFLLLTCPQELRLMTLSSIPNRQASKYLIMSAALTLSCFLPVFAQQEDLTPPKAEIKLTVGAADFGTNQGSIAHGLAGGSVRIYITRHLSVEPEFLYLRNSPDDQDYIIQPNVAYDLAGPTKRFVPYVIGGVGVIHHRGRFFGVDFTTRQPRVFDASGTGWTASGGGGVKIFLTKRLFIAPEGRVGRQPSVRGTISIGYVSSGRK
jgi:hypothetical protein